MTEVDQMASTLPSGLEPTGETWAYIAMPGRIANALAELPTRLVDEAKLNVDAEEREITSLFVDPANVGMGGFTLQLDSDLGIYQADLNRSFTVGIRLDWLRSRMKWARKGRGGLESGDDVHLLLDKGARKATCRVERRIERTSSIGTLDPDSIRQEPDIPDLDLDSKATDVTAKDFRAGVDAAREVSDHARIGGKHRDGTGCLHIFSQGDLADEDIIIPDAGSTLDIDESVSSLFSMDYLRDMAKNMDAVTPDHLTIRWGDEFPAKFEFGQSEWGLEAEYMLAPRIQGD